MGVGGPSRETGVVLPWKPPYLQWVVKVSKYCNLRCRYCYEYPHLGDRSRLSSEQLEAMFENIASGFAGDKRRHDFVWHGGEPLLTKPSYFWSIHDLQERTLGRAGIVYTNSLQTNLTILTPDTLALMRSFFTHVGVSIDVIGDQRVDAKGVPAEPRVVANMQTLIDEGIRFGCISVLSTANVNCIHQIYQFFEDIDVSFRLLPIYRTGYAGQQDTFSLTFTQIVGAFQEVVDHWLASESSIQVQPIQDYIAHVLRHLGGEARWSRYYDKSDGEVVLIVDTDGRVFSNGDAYDERLCHGNIVSQAWHEIRSSAGFNRALKATNARMAETCAKCKYHGSCSGYFMGEATPEQRWMSPQGRLICGVAQPVQAYIENILLSNGLPERLRERFIAEPSQASAPEFL